MLFKNSRIKKKVIKVPKFVGEFKILEVLKINTPIKITLQVRGVN